jgi:hypothetical protein
MAPPTINDHGKSNPVATLIMKHPPNTAANFANSARA